MPMKMLARRFDLEKRSQILAVLGGMWLFQGLGILFGQGRVPVGYPHGEIPTWLRGLAWCACGAYAAWFGLRRRADDAWAFTALTAMPMIHLCSAAFALAMWALPGGPAGQPFAWTVVAVWGAVVQTMMILADWPNPIHSPRRP